MDRCQICNKKLGKVHGHLIEKSPYFKVDRSCYKCATILEFIFEGDSLYTTTFIADGLKMEINHQNETSSFYKLSVRELAAFSGYVSVNWDELVTLDEVYDFDIQNIKGMKAKLETMLLFS